ncbi:NADP-dependent oxidoreductase [Sphingobium sp. 22B]|uniref:NADP-dependent oxidoreductase n=1 Tax=unclassified Sphingobium TaxID=2611147 RepID=UPI0007809687|nr:MULTISPECIES: NADP-dependent oxidoreductase [unclassified Sphingobium]KXU33825.1 NADP-dependent oxidoreductase [Sphingobium sp. AM]KYC33769.1 NADP-dependent oxidoreductase [Sphingobium sp. 22B]OAP33507.1 NADP-dependent oxidoreductase [Sphingobium sp. 20006FA]
MASKFVPDYGLPASNRRVLLVRRPRGIPQAEDFALDEAPVEPLAEGRFLVRNLFLSVDPAQRGWACDDRNYSEPVPLGGVMRALAVGVIVESRHAGHKAGSFVYGWFGWQDFCVAGPEQLITQTETLLAPLSAYAGVLGINGLTAWLAFHRIGRPEPGDRVLVSTAAGAVGSIVGQLARESGCHVVGLTGDEEKRRRCVDRFGYHDAANYKQGNLAETVERLAPEGVDIFFDNVGGETLDVVIRAMRVGGRIVQCGTASIAAWTPPPMGLRNEREILTRRLCWGGFVIFDHAARFETASAELVRLIDAGRLVHAEDIMQGIESAPAAIGRLYAGENRGKNLIYIG